MLPMTTLADSFDDEFIFLENDVHDFDDTPNELNINRRFATRSTYLTSQATLISFNGFRKLYSGPLRLCPLELFSSSSSSSPSALLFSSKASVPCSSHSSMFLSITAGHSTLSMF